MPNYIGRKKAAEQEEAALLRALRFGAWVEAAQLAERAGRPREATARRLRKLEERSVVKSRRGRHDPFSTRIIIQYRLLEPGAEVNE